MNQSGEDGAGTQEPFGFVVGGLKAAPEAFNQWMLFTYPNLLIAIQLLNTWLSLTLFGLVLGWLLQRFGGVQRLAATPT